MAPLVVVGAGVAGVATAQAAAGAGLDVVVVRGGSGASCLYSGAVDDADGAVVTPELASFVSSLGFCVTGACQVATRAGCLRPASGRDPSVLDIASLRAGAVVAVAKVGRVGWDADALARSYEADPWARERGLKFVALDVELLRYAAEDRLCDRDFASRLDEPGRMAWTAVQMARVLGDHRAVLCGPWLGLSGDVARELSSRMGRPVGEALSGDVAGARFERARDRLLRADRVRAVSGRATRTSGLCVELESGERLPAAAVVLAAGGLVGGGIVFRDPDASAWQGGGAARTSGLAAAIDSEAAVGARGRAFAGSGSALGPSFETLAWTGGRLAAPFERVGLLADADGAALSSAGTAVPGLFVAGALVADRPRTVLEAVRSGVRAARAAALHVARQRGAEIVPRTT
jgi:glycerol-3-phosphate dehydrogenase subunit B